MTDKTELLSCPFCGGKNVDTSYKDTFSGDFRRGVYCADCCGGIYPYYDTEAEAIAAWNARAERTCEIESSYLNDFTVKNMCWYEFEMKCGYKFTWDVMQPPKFCPNCGGEVKVVDA